MKVWKVLNIPADDKQLENVLNYGIERRGYTVKEILFLESDNQFKIIYTTEETNND